MGSGRTEFALSVFGNPDHYHVNGELFIKGKKHRLGHPQDAIHAGLAYVTEDRKGDGLILIQDVKQNITLANSLKSPDVAWSIITLKSLLPPIIKIP